MKIIEDMYGKDWRERYLQERLDGCPEPPSWERMLEYMKEKDEEEHDADQLHQRERKGWVASLWVSVAAACVAGLLILDLPVNKNKEVASSTIQVPVTANFGKNEQPKINAVQVLMLERAKKKSVARIITPDSIPVNDTAFIPSPNETRDDFALAIPNAEDSAIGAALLLRRKANTIIPVNIFRRELAGLLGQDKNAKDSFNEKPYLRKYKVKSLTEPEQGRAFTNDHHIPSPFN